MLFMKRFGLIGYPLGHSFSRGYFSEKFLQLGLDDHHYDLFELEDIGGFPELWKKIPELHGLNVTVPHKEGVLRFLDELDSSAQKVGAVNVIKKVGDKLVGFNSDFYGFKQSLESWLPEGRKVRNALILGGGGAAKAVEAALRDLDVSYQVVSRHRDKGDLIYEDLKSNPSLFKDVGLIVNTTPLGMHPRIDSKPDLPYECLHAEQYLYDLVYNPEETAFMKEGRLKGAKTKNGLEMLHLQADRSWEIWND